MDAQTFGEPKYGLTRHVPNTTIDKLRPAVEAALQAEGFGVLTEIDVSATLKKKIDVDTPPYLILGACNPKLAHQALSAEPAIGLLLPCNVVLAQQGDGVAVSAIDPVSQFGIVNRTEVEPLAKEVQARLTAALEAVTKS